MDDTTPETTDQSANLPVRSGAEASSTAALERAIREKAGNVEETGETFGVTSRTYTQALGQLQGLREALRLVKVRP